MAPHLAMLAVAALLAAPLAAFAQQGVTYRCTGKDGKKYYGSTIPRQCSGVLIEQLNAQGMVVKRMDPEGDEKERAAKEAEAAKKRELDAAAKEESRRNRALLATYTSEKDVEEARRRALVENEKAISEIETRIANIKKDQVRLAGELEFYKKSKPPGVLTDQIHKAEFDLKTQGESLALKRKEVSSINTKYDDDKKRFLELTKGSTKK